MEQVRPDLGLLAGKQREALEGGLGARPFQRAANCFVCVCLTLTCGQFSSTLQIRFLVQSLAGHFLHSVCIGLVRESLRFALSCARYWLGAATAQASLKPGPPREFTSTKKRFPHVEPLSPTTQLQTATRCAILRGFFVLDCHHYTILHQRSFEGI